MAIRNVKDNSFKLILGDHRLFAEFLRDFIPVPILKDIDPDDIEDLTERFLPLFQDNRESDTVKRINLRDHTPLFVIAVAEHESTVNYRSCFKMLQYICLVLDACEKEINREQPGRTFQKDFRYPPVLPIIFYDGTETWTAERNFRDRTALPEIFGKYIPSFEYELVDLKTYSPEEILRFNDLLSLIMMIDLTGTMNREGFLEKLPKDYLEKLALKIPENLTKLLSDVVLVLLNRFNAPPEEAEAIMEHIEHKEVETMFDALVEKYHKARNEGIEEGRKEAEREKMENARNLKKLGVSVEILQAGFGLSPDEIEKL
jgi:predicted transposase/invertase (TIGR01784 family)